MSYGYEIIILKYTVIFVKAHKRKEFEIKNKLTILI